MYLCGVTVYHKGYMYVCHAALAFEDRVSDDDFVSSIVNIGRMMIWI